MKPMPVVEQLIRQLNRIADANDKSFRYKIEIANHRKDISYGFICEDFREGHTICSAWGQSIEAAANKCRRGLRIDCRDWDFKFVE